MEFRRLRLVISQLGVRRSRTLPEPRDMILGVEDLPAGWRVLDQRRWRTGVSSEPWAVRARQLGGLTAWRSFAFSSEEYLWVQATPLASESDAAAALATSLDYQLKNLRVQVTVTATQDGPALELPQSAVITVEQRTMGPKGPGLVRLLLWAHASVLSVLCGTGTALSWQRLDELARIQTRRIDTIIAK